MPNLLLDEEVGARVAGQVLQHCGASTVEEVGRRLLEEEVAGRVAGGVRQHCGASTVEEVGRRLLEEEVAGRVAGRVWQHCRQPLLLSQINFRDVVPVGETGNVDR